MATTATTPPSPALKAPSITSKTHDEALKCDKTNHQGVEEDSARQVDDAAMSSDDDNDLSKAIRKAIQKASGNAPKASRKQARADRRTEFLSKKHSVDRVKKKSKLDVRVMSAKLGSIYLKNKLGRFRTWQPPAPTSTPASLAKLKELEFKDEADKARQADYATADVIARRVVCVKCRRAYHLMVVGGRDVAIAILKKNLVDPDLIRRFTRQA